MKVNYYMVKFVNGNFKRQLEFIFVTIVVALIFSALAWYSYEIALGNLFLFAIVSAVGCWIVLLAELYYFIRAYLHDRADRDTTE